MKTNLVKKVSTTVVSVATVIALSGAGALLPMTVHGATIAELQAQLTALLAQVAALQAQLASSGVSTSGAVPASLLSSGDLTVGSRGAAVTDLQNYLGMSTVTGYFGNLTKAALAKFQADNGISPAAGYFGRITRAKLSSLSAAGTGTGAVIGTGTGTGTGAVTTVTPLGTGLTVTLAADQPAASLAPFNASRIPFTKVNLTASADGDITVTYLTVKRVGLAADASLESVLLLDDAGNQLGLKKTLNSDHQANVGESMTIKAGQTKTVMVAANRAAASDRGGQTLALQVTGIGTSATVNGALPIQGTTHTVNETLTIGSVTVARGPLDPGASASKEIGTTGYTFSSIKVTAGSTEKVLLKSIRWNQTGSAGSGDLANMKTYVDGTAYDTIVSSDGKYYSTVFSGGGLLIDKGFNKEMYIKGDIIGGSARNITFDVAKMTDLFASGETYGYGIIPPQTGTAAADDASPAFTNSEDPWYNGGKVTVSSGTMTVSAWNTVSAQNIAINLADQPLGGWSVDVKGEAISVASLKFNFHLTENGSGTTGLGLDDLDNVKLIDSTGKTLAGPADPTSTSLSGSALLTFTDTITFPVGVTNIKMIGKLAAGTAAFENNDSIAASTTPSTQWTTVTGTVTGVTITPTPSSGVSGQTMTAKGPAITISVSSVPIAQTIIAGNNQFEFAKYILDTSGSGEDLRLTALPLEYNVASGEANDLTNCKLYDGTTVLNTGTNAVNPTARGSSTSFTFDGSGLTLVKGGSKTLSLKCDLKSAATGSYKWGYNTASSPSPTGLVSGQTATITENGSVGQLMTAASAGSLTVALDSAAAYKLVAPGEEAELVRIKYSATNEDIDIRQVALQLTSAASNTPVDVVGQTVSLYDGATKIGEVVMDATTDFGTSSAITNFRVPKDGSKVMTVKGTIAGISSSGPLTQSGDLLAIDYNGNNASAPNGNYGVGVSSGQNISGGTTDTGSTGVRIMRAYPQFEQIALTSSEKALTAKDGQLMYKFKVTAKQGDINLAKLTFSVGSTTAAGSNATTTKFSVYVFTDSAYSSPDGNFSSGVNAGGLVNAGNCYNGGRNGSNSVSAPGPGNLGTGSVLVEIYPDTVGCASGTTTLKIPSGESRFFKLQASVGTLSPSGTAETFSVQLEGDAAFPTVVPGGISGGTGALMGTVATIDTDTHDDFIWSPRSTTSVQSDTQYQYNLDWTNGYGISGLPTSNMTSETLSK